MQQSKSEWDNFDSLPGYKCYEEMRKWGILGETALESGRGGLGVICWEAISVDRSASLGGGLLKTMQLVWDTQSLILQVSGDPTLPFPPRRPKQKSYGCYITRHWVEQLFLSQQNLRQHDFLLLEWSQLFTTRDYSLNSSKQIGL